MGSLSAQGDCTQTGLTNGGFEYGVPTPGLGFPSEDTGGWTSQNFGVVEIWGSGWNGVPAYAGLNFMELNSFGADVVYQDLATTPGESYNWQVAHRGRFGIDVANLEFGPPEGPSVIEEVMTTNNTAWVLYSGTYIVPAGQSTTRVRIVAVSFSGGCGSCANFIDAFDFQIVEVDTDGDGTVDCNDGCPLDENKIAPGQCGCGNAETDTDEDGTADCNDNCVDTANSGQEDDDCDGVGNACDVCPGGDDMVDNNDDGMPDCHYPPALADIIAAWKCGDKVLVAHYDEYGVCNTICVSRNAVQAHINHGDYIGPCDNATCSQPGFSVPDFDDAANSSEEVVLFPNPAGDEVNIILQGLKSATELNIYDNLGKAIWTSKLAAGQNTVRVDLSGSTFADGMYFIQATSETQIYVKRFVISK